MRRTVLLGNILAILGVVAMTLIGLKNDYDLTLAEAATDVDILRDAMVEHSRQTFAGLSGALASIEDAVDTSDLTGAETHRALALRQSNASATLAMFVLDDKGVLTATSRTPDAETVDFSSDPVFWRQRDNRDLGFLIGPPRMGVVGYAQGQWVIPVSRRLNHPDGRFAGIVAAVVSVDYLTDFYETLRMGRDGVVGLMNGAGQILAQSPLTPGAPGTTAMGGQVPAETLKAKLPDPVLLRASADGVDRIIALGRVPDFPLTVYVGVSRAERLQVWYGHLIFDLSLGVLAIVALAGFTALVFRRYRQEKRLEQARLDHLQKLALVSRGLFEASDVKTTLQLVADAARGLVPCRHASVHLTAGVALTAATRAVYVSGDAVDAGSSAADECEAHLPVPPDSAAQPLWHQGAALGGLHQQTPRRMTVPLIDEEGRSLGVVQLLDPEAGAFTAEDEALISELVHRARATIQRLGLAENLRAALDRSDELRRQAETARAAESQARREVEAVLVSIRDAVVALDDAWRFTFLNPKAEELLERSRDALLGRNVWAAFPEIVGSVVERSCRQAVAQKVDIDFEYHNPRLRRWFDVRVYPHEESGVTVYFQDVTGIREKEEQLHQAQKMEAIGQLTGGIAHDFNNLLTVILGSVDLALDQTEDADPRRRLLGMIEDAGEQASDLINRLLAFSRRQPLEPTAVDVNALVGALKPMLDRSIGEIYTIEVAEGPELGKALVDPGQLKSALVNLVINARDAMVSGGRIRIETAQVRVGPEASDLGAVLAPGNYVSIAVSDTGSGMSPETRARAFEPFFTTKAVGEGSGLGLPMVFGFVRQSGGHVVIRSAEGEGTTVTLYLPVVTVPADHAGAVAEDLSPPRGGERILLVEDEAVVRDHTMSTLRALGYQAVGVADGDAALDLLKAGEEFDLLVCDVILIGAMNGRQVADAARHFLPELRVLFMSGYSDNILVHQGRLDPDVRLLRKPFRRGELARQVHAALREE